MGHRILILTMATALLGACAATEPGPPIVPDRPAAQEVPYLPGEVPDAVLPPGTNANPIPLEPAGKVLRGDAALAQANRNGRREIDSNGFEGVRYVFEIGLTETYPIRVPRDSETVVRFPPEEVVDDYTNPKNTLFEVGKTVAGQDSGESDVLVVRCYADKDAPREKRTASFIAWTDRREYPFELTCQTNGNKVVAFRHRASDQLADGRTLAERAADSAAKVRKFAQRKATLLENVDCNSYRVEGRIMNLQGSLIKVCTDGATTTIGFPSEAAVGGSFPMPSVHPVGQQIPFNYVRKDNPVSGLRQWVADKVIYDAELIHGSERIAIRKVVR